MNAMAGYALIGAMGLTAPLIVIYLVTLAKLFSYMREKHPGHYKELGEPSLFLNNSISNSVSIVRFLLDKDYLGISDPQLNQLGERSRQIFMATVGLLWRRPARLCGAANDVVSTESETDEKRSVPSAMRLSHTRCRDISESLGLMGASL